MNWIRNNKSLFIMTLVAIGMLAFILLEGAENDSEQIVTLGGNMMAEANNTPLQELTGAAGLATVIWLIFAMSCTPLNTVFGWRTAITLRRPAGLFAFAFGLLHIIFFFGQSQFRLGENLGLIFAETRLWIGLIAFGLMLSLAITSNQWSQKLLGKNWKRLHRLVYVVGVLVGIHVVLLEEQSFVALAIIIVLLILRIPVVKRKLRARRYRREQAGKTLA